MWVNWWCSVGMKSLFLRLSAGLQAYQGCSRIGHYTIYNYNTDSLYAVDGLMVQMYRERLKCFNSECKRSILMVPIPSV
jgi:hypothetical protein